MRLGAAIAFILVLVGAPAQAETALPTISAIRPMPAGTSVAARDVSPMDTGWSWTHRVVGTGARIRTTLEGTAAATAKPAPGMPPVFWLKRIDLLQEGKPPTYGAEVAVSFGSDGSVVAVGELKPGQPKLERWDPARLLMPAALTPDATWASGGTRRRVVGLADVDLGRWKFPGCVVVEMGRDGEKPKSGTYLAPGVGEVVGEDANDDGGWRVGKVIEEWTRPSQDDDRHTPDNRGV